MRRVASAGGLGSGVHLKNASFNAERKQPRRAEYYPSDEPDEQYALHTLQLPTHTHTYLAAACSREITRVYTLCFQTRPLTRLLFVHDSIVSVRVCLL